MSDKQDWKKRLSIVSDEAAPGFKESVEISLPLGIRRFELRLLHEDRVPYVSEEAVREVEETLKRHEIEIVGINPGFGKVPVDDPRAGNQLSEGFDDTFRLMDRLSLDRMAMFTYQRTGPDDPIPEKSFELLGKASKRCQEYGCELLLENVPSVWGNTGSRLASFAEHTGLEVIWDPANSDASGEESFPTGYQAVKPFIRNVHLKNWDPDQGYVYLDEGIANIDGQVRALVEDGYLGDFCIESHRWKDPDATRINTNQLLKTLEKL